MVTFELGNKCVIIVFLSYNKYNPPFENGDILSFLTQNLHMHSNTITKLRNDNINVAVDFAV